MPSKTEEYLALAQRTANGLTRYWESWTDYLTTASRLYKYSFADQLMIYAQRPDATACADFDIWNNRMNRYVRRGAKGIALLDESSGFPRLHYVFDVSDTGVRRNSRDPEVWQYNDDLKQPVSEMLSKTYGISGERISQQLADVVGKLVADYWDNNGGDIRAIVDGSLLMDYDEAGVEMQFKSAATISVTYTLLERCGFEPAGWFDKDDFQAIYNFSTPDAVFALGGAVSDMSREVLRNIERTVKTTIRRRNAERSQYEYEQQERDLLDRRGLPAPEPDPEPAPEAAGQVRQAAPDLPETASPGAVPHDADEREPVSAPDGGGADGREPDAQNPDKTEKGELVSSYQCSPLTVDEEFMLTKKLYEQATGRSQKSNVIAYQIRQSFRPGEITAEEANRIGYELASRFLKGKHAFIVATHTDREHIHNHIIYNSTALDGTRKFRDFFFSGLAVQRLSDLICLEHQLSVIEKKPYRERQKRITYPPRESNRDRLCGIIDEILQQEPTDYEEFLQKLEQQGYEIKRGKYTSVKGARQKRFIRFKTLGAGYSEEEIKAVLAGRAKHHPHQKQPPKEQTFQLLVDIQAKLAEGKGGGYERWAKKHNLKEMSKTLIFLQQQKISSADELKECADAALSRYHELGDSIKTSEKRLAEIAVLKAHIINYAKTRPVYDAYRKAGYSKKFLEEHCTEITLHKAAKAAFDESNLKTLPKIKELDAEYSKLLTEKKARYPDYRKARDEMQELLQAQKNIELFFDEEKDPKQTEHSR